MQRAQGDDACLAPRNRGDSRERRGTPHTQRACVKTRGSRRRLTGACGAAISAGPSSTASDAIARIRRQPGGHGRKSMPVSEDQTQGPHPGSAEEVPGTACSLPSHCGRKMLMPRAGNPECVGRPSQWPETISNKRGCRALHHEDSGSAFFRTPPLAACPPPPLSCVAGTRGAPW
jgi:hypothetical protein